MTNASSNRPMKPLLLVRLAAGVIFLSEGVQKFLFVEALGAGRFARIGLPAPQALATFVGLVEIVCGLLLLLGLFTRLAAIPLIMNMLVAISTTKIPMLAKAGFWAMAHEARVDFAMLLICVMLALMGAGPLSLDARVRHRGETGSD